MGVDRLAWVWHGYLARMWTCVRVAVLTKAIVASRQVVGFDIHFLYDGAGATRPRPPLDFLGQNNRSQEEGEVPA
eukprot:11158156-Lingulodinium_polyedra.AAC.1